MNRISIKEEEARELTSVYSEFHEGMTFDFNGMIEELTGISSRTGYIKIRDYVNELINYYNEEFRESLKSDYEKWRESESSFSNYVLKLEGAEQADITEASAIAQKIENDLSDAIQLENSIDFLDHRVDGIDLSDNDYDEFSDVIKEYLSEDGKLLERCRDVKKNLETRNEDNLIFGMVLPLIISFEKRLQHSLEQYVKEVDVKKEEFLSSKTALNNATEAVAKEIESNSADLPAFLAKTKSKFSR